MINYKTKKVVEDSKVVYSITCDKCGKYVVKNGKCASDFWKSLSVDDIFPEAEYQLCRICFSKFTDKFLNLKK